MSQTNNVNIFTAPNPIKKGVEKVTQVKLSSKSTADKSIKTECSNHYKAIVSNRMILFIFTRAVATLVYNYTKISKKTTIHPTKTSIEKFDNFNNESYKPDSAKYSDIANADAVPFNMIFYNHFIAYTAKNSPLNTLMEAIIDDSKIQSTPEGHIPIKYGFVPQSEAISEKWRKGIFGENDENLEEFKKLPKCEKATQNQILDVILYLAGIAFVNATEEGCKTLKSAIWRIIPNLRIKTLELNNIDNDDSREIILHQLNILDMVASNKSIDPVESSEDEKPGPVAPKSGARGLITKTVRNARNRSEASPVEEPVEKSETELDDEIDEDDLDDVDI